MEIRQSDLAIGLAGMAIMRRMPHDPAGIQEVSSMLERALTDGADADEGIDSVEMAPADGYAEWARTYDERANAMVAIEEPIVDTILGPLEPGRALDAACGTGRHTERLVDLGWNVVGVDASSDMLDVARSKLPGVQFDQGDLTALPLADESVDLVICALALTHIADLAAAIGEFVRVTVPGGTIITTDIHPFATETGAHAFYAQDAAGLRFIRNRTHLHSEYLDAFAQLGLVVVSCHEPVFRPDLVEIGTDGSYLPNLLLRAVGGLPGVLVWHCRVS